MHSQIQLSPVITEQPNAAANTEDFEFAALSEARNYRQAMVTEFSPYLSGRVLEIGAGIGQITQALRDLPQLQYLLPVEPSPGFCAQFRRNYPGQPLVEGTIQDIEGQRNWNAILSVNVLEHIRNDEEELRHYHEHLKQERGCLCLFVPARPEIFAPLDADFGHFRRYTKPALRQKLDEAGFEIVRLQYFNVVGYFAWWASFCLLKKRCFNPKAVRFFDRCIFPFVYRAEKHLCAPPFGQSLLAVARAV